jgi:RNA polymerase sigma factor (sigma-70 family)
VSQEHDERVAEFVRLTAPYFKQLYGMARALCRDADQAHDLTQEALVRAFEAFDAFRPGSPIMPWLRQIMRHLFLDSFKTGRARHEIAEREMISNGSSPLQAAADDQANPLDQVERAQLSRWIQSEIATLDPAHQQVLLLCVMQELSFEEAAEVAGIPLGTVASRLARARAQLRAQILRKAGAEKKTSAGVVDKKEAFTRTPLTGEDRGSRGASLAEPRMVLEKKTPP